MSRCYARAKRTAVSHRTVLLRWLLRCDYCTTKIGDLPLSIALGMHKRRFIHVAAAAKYKKRQAETPTKEALPVGFPSSQSRWDQLTAKQLQALLRAMDCPVVGIWSDLLSRVKKEWSKGWQVAQCTQESKVDGPALKKSKKNSSAVLSTSPCFLLVGPQGNSVVVEWERKWCSERVRKPRQQDPCGSDSEAPDVPFEGGRQESPAAEAPDTVPMQAPSEFEEDKIRESAVMLIHPDQHKHVTFMGMGPSEVSVREVDHGKLTRKTEHSDDAQDLIAKYRRQYMEQGWKPPAALFDEEDFQALLKLFKTPDTKKWAEAYLNLRRSPLCNGDASSAVNGLLSLQTGLASSVDDLHDEDADSIQGYIKYFYKPALNPNLEVLEPLNSKPDDRIDADAET